MASKPKNLCHFVGIILLILFIFQLIEISIETNKEEAGFIDKTKKTEKNDYELSVQKEENYKLHVENFLKIHRGPTKINNPAIYLASPNANGSDSKLKTTRLLDQNQHHFDVFEVPRHEKELHSLSVNEIHQFNLELPEDQRIAQYDRMPFFHKYWYRKGPSPVAEIEMRQRDLKMYDENFSDVNDLKKELFIIILSEVGNISKRKALRQTFLRNFPGVYKFFVGRVDHLGPDPKAQKIEDKISAENNANKDIIVLENIFENEKEFLEESKNDYLFAQKTVKLKSALKYTTENLRKSHQNSWILIQNDSTAVIIKRIHQILQENYPIETFPNLYLGHMVNDFVERSESNSKFPESSTFNDTQHQMNDESFQSGPFENQVNKVNSITDKMEEKFYLADTYIGYPIENNTIENKFASYHRRKNTVDFLEARSPYDLDLDLLDNKFVYPTFALGSTIIISHSIASYITENHDNLKNYQRFDAALGIWIDQAFSGISFDVSSDKPDNPGKNLAITYVNYHGVEVWDDRDDHDIVFLENFEKPTKINFLNQAKWLLKKCSKVGDRNSVIYSLGEYFDTEEFQFCYSRYMYKAYKALVKYSDREIVVSNENLDDDQIRENAMNLWDEYNEMRSRDEGEDNLLDLSDQDLTKKQKYFNILGKLRYQMKHRKTSANNLIQKGSKSDYEICRDLSHDPLLNQKLNIYDVFEDTRGLRSCLMNYCGPNFKNPISGYGKDGLGRIDDGDRNLFFFVGIVVISIITWSVGTFLEFCCGAEFIYTKNSNYRRFH